MKKFDIKKIGIILAIVVVLVLAIFLIGKAIKGGSVDKKDLEKYENYVVNYYMNLTAGYNTSYNGLEALYASDETTMENVTDKQLISTAVEYITKNATSTSVDYATMIAIYSDDYPEIKDAMLYNAEDIRNGIKELYGITNFANPTIKGDITNLSSYIYIPEEDIYIVSAGDLSQSKLSKTQSIDYSIISTEVKSEKIVTTVAIAYRDFNGKTYIYASDRYGEKIVAEEVSKFPTDKIDKFDKYEFTLSKTKDGKKYVFESVKKVK